MQSEIELVERLLSGAFPAEETLQTFERYEAQQSLESFIGLVAPETIPARHHRLLLNKLEAVARGEIPRLMVMMPPGSAKSTYASILFPPWYLGNNPHKSVLGASHAGELAERFGRRARNIVASDEFRYVFGFGVSETNAAAGRWETEPGGEYYAVGVDASVTGRRTDLGIIDDPVKGRAEADSASIRQRTWDWYKADFWPRLKPSGAIVVITCMTGDTPVLMSDGTEKPLGYIRVGDVVATYDAGRLSCSLVTNWKNQGVDDIFEIRMKSGIVVRANARHPFLVCDNGEEKWQRTASLKKGDIIRRVIGGNGKELRALSRDVANPRSAKATALPITAKHDGPMELDRPRLIRVPFVRRTCDIVTESILQIMSVFLPNKAEFALSANSRWHPPIKNTSASIMTMIRERFADYCATIATSSSERDRRRKYYSAPLDTFEIIGDEIVSIMPCGREDVFDIEVDRTGNFIANGLISHNTRWHEDDLAGRLLAEQEVGGEHWEVLSLPAEATADDPLGRVPGELLWPEWFTPAMFTEAKRDLRNWSALYQQQPTPDTGDYFRTEWIRWYEQAPARQTMRIYGASDYAVTADGGDYTVHGVVGVDPNDDIYILDWWRRQAASDEWVDVFCDMAEGWKPLMWGVEKGQIARGVGPFLDKRLRERRVYPYRKEFASAADKATRARAFQGRMAMGKVYFPKRAVWVNDLVSELLRFDAGRNDDQVDVLSLVGRMLDTMVGGSLPKRSLPIRSAAEMTMDEAWKLARAGMNEKGERARI